MRVGEGTRSIPAGEKMIERESSNRAALSVFYGKSIIVDLYGTKYEGLVHPDVKQGILVFVPFNGVG